MKIPICPMLVLVPAALQLKLRFQLGPFASWLSLPTVLPNAVVLISPERVVSALATSGPLPRAP